AAGGTLEATNRDPLCKLLHRRRTATDDSPRGAPMHMSAPDRQHVTRGAPCAGVGYTGQGRKVETLRVAVAQGANRYTPLRASHTDCGGSESERELPDS